MVKLTVKEIAEMMGEDIIEVKEENKWVVCVYPHMTVRFKKWTR